MTDLVHVRDAFESVERRRFSPEWDFGVHWQFSDRGPEWPRYRVSWILETGELYAVANTGPDARNVHVLAVVEKVGDYPYPSDSAGGYSSGRAWTTFKDAQEIERLMDGWADEGRSLDWIRRRVADRDAAAVPARSR
jgi:hypothetical protein